MKTKTNCAVLLQCQNLKKLFRFKQGQSVKRTIHTYNLHSHVALGTKGASVQEKQTVLK